MSGWAWIVVAALVALLGALQIVGVRALHGWGVRSSTGVLVLRAFNFVVVVGILLFALWKWVA